MTCSSCGHSNPDTNRFCGGCGAPLATVPVGAPPRSYTPRHLAEKILTSRAALKGERKQVTVLFADVKGSMDLAEQVDDELFGAPIAHAQSCFGQALEIARQQRAKSLALRAAMSLCRLCRQQGRTADARRQLAELYTSFTEGFDTRDLREAKALLEELR